MSKAFDLKNVAPHGKIYPTVCHLGGDHTFYYSFIVHKIGELGNWTFQDVLETEYSPENPSTWLLEMKFKKVLTDENSTSIPISIKRTDASDNVLKIDVRPYVELKKFGPDFSFNATPFVKEFRSGDEMQETIVKELTSEEQREMFNRVVNVMLFVRVFSCTAGAEKKTE